MNRGVLLTQININCCPVYSGLAYYYATCYETLGGSIYAVAQRSGGHDTDGMDAVHLSSGRWTR